LALAIGKAMHRFYLTPEECGRRPLALADREAHHALDVLRLRRGERVVVLDGAGRELGCQARQAEGKTVILDVVEKRCIARPPGQVTLAQAIPKGKRMDEVIQKATELGVARIVPLLCERVTTQLDEAAARQKAGKWRQAAIEAIKQCGQPWLPQVESPLTPAAFLARGEAFDLALAGSLQGDGRHARQYFEAFAAKHARPPRSICVWIGPEGDFTADELDAIRQAGAKPVTLGPLILRTDTAALCALAIVNYELQASAQAPG
jgi:16S rRNA (uracil1498-N3)-methyltransferase